MNTLGQCIRAFLVLYNIIIMGAAVGALSTITWLIISRSFLGRLIGLHMYIGFLYMLLIVSSLVMLISFLGCFGAANKVKWMLYLYGVILSIVFVILFISSMLGLLVRDHSSKMIRNGLLNTMDTYSEDSRIRQAWDEIQPYFMCCGVDSYEDWIENIPQSCCRIVRYTSDPSCNVTSKPPTAIYEDGCYSLLSNLISSNLMYICISGLVTGLLEVLCSAFSFALATIILQDELLGKKFSRKVNLYDERMSTYDDLE